MYVYNKKLVARDFDRAAARYDDYAELQRRAGDALLTLAAGAFPVSARVLDLGCGTGYLARHAPRGWSVTQLDISRAMCARAQDAAVTLQADMEHLPFNATCFDAAISSLALQWTEPRAVFAEVARVLRSGGLFACATLGPQTFRELKTVLSAETGTARTSDFPERSYLEQAWQGAGFETLTWQEETTREFWPDALALMRGIKAIGAANKGEDRLQALTEKRLKSAADHYRKAYPAPGGVYATWQVWHAVLKKT